MATTQSAPKAAKKTAAKGAVKKAAAAEVAGGGPEDPIADVAAAGELAKGVTGGGKKKTPPAQSAQASGPKVGGNKALLAEFIICLTILGLGSIVKPGTSTNLVPRLMLKSSALAGLFLILSLTSAMGGKAKKTAGAIGALVTVTYIVTSSDAIALFNWATSYFGGAAYKAGQGIGELGGAVSGGASVTTEGNTSTPTPGTPGGGSSGAAE